MKVGSGEVTVVTATRLPSVSTGPGPGDKAVNQAGPHPEEGRRLTPPPGGAKTGITKVNAKVKAWGAPGAGRAERGTQAGTDRVRREGGK